MQLSRFAKSLYIPRFTFAQSYYNILGVSNNATLEEITNAYIQKAKNFYPSVQTNSPVDTTQGEEFQKIAEAYAVLSVQESRNSYDLMNQERPEFVYSANKQAFETYVNDRGEDGQKKRPGYAAGSYAEERRFWLAQERKRFNVDEFGRYRGGLPQPERGVARGKALLEPGVYHNPLIHNIKIDPMSYEQPVSVTQAQEFKLWQDIQKEGKQWKWLYQTANIDYDFWKFKSTRVAWRWGRNLFFVFIALPWLVKALMSRHARQISDGVTRLGGQSVEGKLFGGHAVQISPNGVLRYATKEQRHHH